MSTKLFYKSNDRLYITSYRRANIRILAEHCIHDVKKLSTYLHKIVQFRLFTIKYIFLHILASRQMSLHSCSVLNVFFMRYFVNATTSRSAFNVFYTSHFYNTLELSCLLYCTYGLFFGYYALCFELYKFTMFYKKGLCSLPTRHSKYTLLRSPHTDKKSREHFERCIHRKVYMFPSMLSGYYSLLCDAHYVFMSCALVHEYNVLCNE